MLKVNTPQKMHSMSTLMSTPKKELVEHIMFLEHSNRVQWETLNQQAINFEILLKEERRKFVKELVDQLDDLGKFCGILMEDVDGWDNFVPVREVIKLVRAGVENGSE